MTKTGLLGAIEKSGSKLDIRRPGTWWVGASEQSGSERLGGVSNRGVSIAERAIGKQGTGERENLGTSDWEVIEIKNTV